MLALRTDFNENTVPKMLRLLRLDLLVTNGTRCIR